MISILLLKKCCKVLLIDRIIHFIKTGTIKGIPKIPRVSRAQKGKQYPLHPDTLILKGSYKNDLKTRLFFKNLIGNHFHFTAFGIDWLNDQWLQGNPPTFQEFSDMWQQEYEQRKKQKAQPKEEWAYINFVQRFIKANSNSSKSTIQNAWKEEQAKQVEIVYQMLKDMLIVSQL